MSVNRLLLFAFSLIIASCASNPAPDYVLFKGIPRGSEITVVTFPGISSLDTPEDKIGERILQGAGVGLAVGASTGFQLGEDFTGDCGEFIIVCIGLIPIFGAVGLAGGAMVGGVVGLIEELPETSVKSIETIITENLSDNEPNELLAVQFEEAANIRWDVKNNAKTEVVVAMIGIRAVRESGDLLSFEITHAMNVNYNKNNLGSTKPIHHRVKTKAYSIDDWVAGGSDRLAEEMSKLRNESIDVFIKVLLKQI